MCFEWRPVSGKLGRNLSTIHLEHDGPTEPSNKRGESCSLGRMGWGERKDVNWKRFVSGPGAAEERENEQTTPTASTREARHNLATSNWTQVVESTSWLPEASWLPPPPSLGVCVSFFFFFVPSCTLPPFSSCEEKEKFGLVASLAHCTMWFLFLTSHAWRC